MEKDHGNSNQKKADIVLISHTERKNNLKGYFIKVNKRLNSLGR